MIFRYSILNYFHIWCCIAISGQCKKKRCHLLKELQQFQLKNSRKKSTAANKVTIKQEQCQIVWSLRKKEKQRIRTSMPVHFHIKLCLILILQMSCSSCKKTPFLDDGEILLYINNIDHDQKFYMNINLLFLELTLRLVFLYKYNKKCRVSKLQTNSQ